MENQIAFGINTIATLLAHAPERVRSLHIFEQTKNKRLSKLIAEASKKSIATEFHDAKNFETFLISHQIDTAAVHQGIIAVFQAAEIRDEQWLLSLAESDRKPFFLVLDGVTDPHNLGACIRSACAAGVDAVVVPKDRSASLSASVRKVACGATEITPLVVAKNLARLLKQLQKKNVWVMGAVGRADSSLYDLDLSGGLALVMGAEGDGLRRLTEENCDQLFSIPMVGSVESLNVSVAAGICLFEAVRQRVLLHS